MRVIREYAKLKVTDKPYRPSAAHTPAQWAPHTPNATTDVWTEETFTLDASLMAATDVLSFELTRLGSDGLDTHTGVMHMYQFELRYTMDKMGA